MFEFRLLHALWINPDGSTEDPTPQIGTWSVRNTVLLCQNASYLLMQVDNALTKPWLVMTNFLRHSLVYICTYTLKLQRE